MQFLRLGFAQQKDSQKLYHGLLFAENLSPFYNGEREKRGGFCVAETSLYPPPPVRTAIKFFAQSP